MHGFHKVLDIGDKTLRRLQTYFKHVWFVLHDEKNITGTGQAGAMDIRCDQIFPEGDRRARFPADPFGDGRFDKTPIPEGFERRPQGMRKFAGNVL